MYICTHYMCIHVCIHTHYNILYIYIYIYTHLFAEAAHNSILIPAARGLAEAGAVSIIIYS